MLFITLILCVIFGWIYISASNEFPSINSGPNFVFSTIMVLILFILISFSTLTVSLDEKNIRIKFGYGIFSRNFELNQIASAHAVKNHWYYGWGIRFWLWPKMWIYNVSGFDAVEIIMKNGKVYRIGIDTPKELETALKKSIQ